MGYSIRNGKLGFECEVCWRFVGDLRLSNFCRRCHKLICTLCSIPHFFTNKLPPQFLRSRRMDKLSYVCPDCKEELESEEIDVQAEDEEESPRPITKCSLCAATDEPPDLKYSDIARLIFQTAKDAEKSRLLKIVSEAQPT